jgi:hypothetical protein
MHLINNNPVINNRRDREKRFKIKRDIDQQHPERKNAAVIIMQR